MVAPPAAGASLTAVGVRGSRFEVLVRPAHVIGLRYLKFSTTTRSAPKDTNFAKRSERPFGLSDIPNPPASMTISCGSPPDTGAERNEVGAKINGPLLVGLRLPAMYQPSGLWTRAKDASSSQESCWVYMIWKAGDRGASPSSGTSSQRDIAVCDATTTAAEPSYEGRPPAMPILTAAPPPFVGTFQTPSVAE